MLVYVKAAWFGLRSGIKMIHEEVFNKRIPKWSCWLLSLLMLPINILLLIYCAIFNRQAIIEAGEDANKRGA